MESKTTEFFADLERETDEMITELNYLLAASEEDNKAFLAYLEDEPLPELPELDLEIPDELLDCVW
ncbi:TPA: hypothetical protein ACQ7HI_005181 [Klebsiella pneumoniae]